MKVFENKGKSFACVILNGKEDYQAWSFTMRQHLTTAGLVDLISPKAKTESTNDNISNQENQNEAKSILLSVLAPGEISKIIHCNSAHEIWNHFESTYGKESSNKKLDLMNEMNSLKCPTVKEVADTINKLIQIQGKLRNENVVLDDQMVISTIIRILPKPAYDTFVESWLMLDVECQTLNKFVEKALDKTKNLLSNWVADNEQVMVAQQGRAPGPAFLNRYNKFRVYGRPTQPRTKLDNTNEDGPLICNYCKKIGHWKEDCWKLKRRNQQLAGSSDPHTAEINKDDAVNFLAMNINYMALENKINNIGSRWIADSGCSRHMTPNRAWFSSFEKFEQPKMIRIGDDSLLEAVGSGQIKTTAGNINAVYLVPKLAASLFSLSQAADNQIKIEINNARLELVYQDQVVLRGNRLGGTYVIKFDVITAVRASCALTATTLENWHQRLNHLPKPLIEQMIKNNNVEGLRVKPQDEECIDCKMNKCTRTSHPPRTTPKSTQAGQCIHADVIGPIKPEGAQGQRFILNCRDESSGLRIVANLKAKSQVPEVMKLIINQIELQTNRYVSRLCVDNGSEFLSERLTVFLHQRGIDLSLSVRYTPQQNGMIERENRTLLTQALIMLQKSKLDKSLWPEAVNCATYVHNRTISRRRPITPYELWFKKLPNISNLKIFGQQAVVLTPEQLREKLGERGKIMNFVSYTGKFNTFKFYSPQENRIIISCDAIFLNAIGPIITKKVDTTPQMDQTTVHINNDPVSLHPNVNNQEENLGEEKEFDFDIPLPPNSESDQTDTFEDHIQQLQESIDNSEKEAVTAEEDIADQEIVINKSTSRETGDVRRTVSSNDLENLVDRTETEQSVDLSNRRTLRNLEKTDYKAMAKGDWNLAARMAQETGYTANSLPQNYTEAMRGSDAEQWRQATDDEMESMIVNQVFQLVEKPTANIVGCRRVFTHKRTADDGIRFKARLVAKSTPGQKGTNSLSNRSMYLLQG